MNAVDDVPNLSQNKRYSERLHHEATLPLDQNQGSFDIEHTGEAVEAPIQSQCHDILDKET